MEYKSNPGLYAKLSQPKASLAQANADVTAFLAAMQEAREKFGIRDVVLVVDFGCHKAVAVVDRERQHALDKLGCGASVAAPVVRVFLVVHAAGCNYLCRVVVA